MYRCEEAKACDKWSTYVKIELNESLVHLRERFAINDYGVFKTKAAGKGIYKEFLFGIEGKEYELVGRSIFDLSDL